MGDLTDTDRCRQLRRTLQVLRLMVQRPHSLYEIAAILQVSPRTIRRDIYAWRGAGLDVETRLTPTAPYQTLYFVRWAAWIGLSGQAAFPVERKVG